MTGDIYEMLITGLKEAADYARGKSPALVAKYENGKLVSRKWQMSDGTEVPGYDNKSGVESMAAGADEESPHSRNGSV